MERGRRIYLLIAVALLAGTVNARVLMTQQQALALAFPPPAKVVRQTVFLTSAQLEEACRRSGVSFDEQLVIRYVATDGTRVLGYAYFDTHRVRTMPATVMVVVTADGKVDRIEILAFDEPTDYFPKRRWIDQIHGRGLDEDLSLRGAIRPLSGASLTSRAILNASRKILAIHKVIE